MTVTPMVRALLAVRSVYRGKEKAHNFSSLIDEMQRIVFDER